MYERLERLREELKKATKRRDEADAKVKSVSEKLKNAENDQILAEIGTMKLTPEQVAEILAKARAGQLGQETELTVQTSTPPSVDEMDSDDGEEENGEGDY